ncbi:hypothetical protein HNR38_002931 [Marinobacter oulmenensis]|uniref:Transporting ATPase n=2 Tax=Marinobacter oulmenensis TaxID=643747 RepID=A0A840UG17_9GAMM|nr:hypothetical protein [Marinobacter oulmenensis]
MDTGAGAKFPLELPTLKSHNSQPMTHNPDDLIMLFNDLFRESFRTILVRGGDEPEYLPVDESDGLARVVFARGFFASALHEIAHWCIAGEYRRTLYDFGYWYCPDGRTPAQQKAFEQAEIKPQAMEWVFSVAAGSRFNISVDNLSGDGAADERAFRRQVRSQAERYLSQGLPDRAQLFFDSLAHFYGTQGRIHQTWKTERERIAPAGPELKQQGLH